MVVQGHWEISHSLCAWPIFQHHGQLRASSWSLGIYIWATSNCAFNSCWSHLCQLCYLFFTVIWLWSVCVIWCGDVGMDLVSYKSGCFVSSISCVWIKGGEGRQFFNCGCGTSDSVWMWISWRHKQRLKVTHAKIYRSETSKICRICLLSIILHKPTIPVCLHVGRHNIIWRKFNFVRKIF